MKKMSKIFVLAIVLMVLCCIGAASATDNSTADEVALSDEVVDVETVDEQESIASSEEVIDEDVLGDGENNESSSTESSKVIYVGHHNTTDGGNGSYDNPYTTFKAACDSVNGEDSVILNVFNGTYYLGEGFAKDANTPLKFNTSNLNITGINGSVIIKNYYDDNKGYNAEAFALTSSSANFTFSNIIFDFSDSHVNYYENVRKGKYCYVLPFWGSANLGIFYNCSFILPNNVNNIMGSEFNSKFIKCSIVRKDETQLFVKAFVVNTTHSFEYCIFNYDSSNLQTIYLPCDISFDSVWFGQNSLPAYVGPYSGGVVANPDGTWNNTWSIPVNRYAIFSVSQNYLGNNQYEILGKLTWNGTEDQDGMENFQPMTVTLTSTTGEVNNATLVNGNFRAVYTNTNPNNKITVTLDQEEKELNFNTTDIILEPVSIKYGEDQNITVTFPQAINSTVTISINNKTYEVKVNESNSFTYTIKDMMLKADTYIVNVTLNDDKAGLYGANSTTFTVSKVSEYAFSPDIPSEAKVGENKTVTVELPSDANGTVTVYVNNKPFTKEASTNTEITVNGLVAGDNNITVEYSGNDKYAKKSTEQIITAEKVSAYDFDVILPTGVKVGDSTNITIKLPDDVNGSATVYVGTQDGVVVPVNSSSTIVPISGLVAGNNTIKVVFGDGKYVENTVTKNLTVEKVPVEITNNTIVVNTPTGTAAPTVSFNLPNATGNLTVIVKGKTYTKELVNGTATVTITDLPAGTYNATVTYSGDDKFDSINTTTKITVNEAKQPDQKTDDQTKKVTKVATKIVAKNKKFKAKTKVKKYTITLKAGKKPVKKVQVTIKIGKKTYKAKTNAKGKATFKIKKLTKKAKYKATIKFKGNKNYKATSKKVTITIK